jgi:P4 family phage/plasmid primase-like protien
MDEYRKFLNQFRCEKGALVQYTHTSIGNPRGSYAIPINRMSEFYEAYNRAIVKGVSLHLTEKPCDPSPMRADLDFRFPLPNPKPEGNMPRMYTQEHVAAIVRAYGNIIASFVEKEHHDQIVAYVMEKSTPTEHRGKIKDGIHIVWPHIVLSHNVHHLIRKHILNAASQIFAGMHLCNPFEEIVDSAIIDKNNWQLYGSKKPDCEAYRVTYIYKYVPAPDESPSPDSPDQDADADTAADAATEGVAGDVIVQPLPSAVEELNFVQLFSMRDKQDLVAQIKEDKAEEVEQYIRHVKPSQGERRKTKLNNQIFGKSINMSRNVNEDDYILAKELVECLNPRRAESYEDWIKLGWTLRNIDYRLLDTWVEFSRISSKYVEGECNESWDKMRSDTLGIGTLRWWARQDNPQKYEEIRNTNVVQLIDRCCGSKGAHYDVACVVHVLYKDKYRYTVKDTWFMYVEDKHKWVRTREGLKLRHILSNDVWRRFSDRSNYWSNEAGKIQDQNEQERLINKSKTLMEICLKLKTSGYKDSIMKECKSLFTDENFEELLDSHTHLIGFENGVYDLRMHEFREGLPDDFISFTTGRHYVPYDPNSNEAQEVEVYLSQVFTNANVRMYMRNMFACVIDGSIRQEKFYIFTGSGCHAKDTEIMMYDGKKKLVQDITTEDVLMGDDSTPRKVLELFRGKSQMYKIIPVKGDPFTVNEDHKISLKTTLSSYPRITTSSDEFRVKWTERTFYTPEDGSIAVAKEKCFKQKEDAQIFLNTLATKKDVLQLGDVIDVQVKNYLNFNMHRLNMYLFKTGVDFSEKSIKMDPYMLGCWIGDGASLGPAITTMDPEIVEYWSSHLPENHQLNLREGSIKSNGKARTYGVVFTGKRRKYISDNSILNALRDYNLIQNKHIPDDYKHNTREVRMKVLAGMLDTDGTYQEHCNQYIFSQKSERVTDDLVDLARSLGFAAYKRPIKATCTHKGKQITGDYFRVNIYGSGIEEIPCLLPRKKAHARVKRKDALLNKFKVEKLDVDDYYGFEVSDNHRYLMGDFTVTANSNSKSLLLNLFQRAIGDYYCILPIALLTQKRTASNAAQSELERTRGRRCAVMQEPGDGEKLNIGLMKELSGGDRILTRGLFKEPIEFKPQFKMIMTCNELPEVPSDDGGTWRRIRVIEYTSRFVERPDPTKPREFPIDPEMIDKLDRWADTFISMLVDHHKKIDPRNIDEPLEVRIATEGYKKNNDVIGQYVNDKVCRDDTCKEKLQLTKFYADFKTWAYHNMPKGKKVPERTQFKTYIEKTFGAYPGDSKGWRKLRIKPTQTEDQSDDEDAATTATPGPSTRTTPAATPVGTPAPAPKSTTATPKPKTPKTPKTPK